MGTWNEYRLYAEGDICFGWNRADYWENKEEKDRLFAERYPLSSDYTHAIELLPIWW